MALGLLAQRGTHDQRPLSTPIAQVHRSGPPNPLWVIFISPPPTLQAKPYDRGIIDSVRDVEDSRAALERMDSERASLDGGECVSKTLADGDG